MRSNMNLLAIIVLGGTTHGLKMKIGDPIDRRAAITQATRLGSFGIGAVSLLGPSSAEAISSSSNIASRFDDSTLYMPPPSRGSELNGVDNTYYPSWLEGDWDATQTLIQTSAPLGLRFLGGPSGSEAIAAKSMDEQQKQVGVPVRLQLRWVPTKFGVAEDRCFNLQQRLNSFAGKNVVASVEYADVGGSNRKSVLAMGGSESDPLQTTLVYFKGPAAQKTFLVAHGGATADDNTLSWSGYELSRSIFALTNGNTAPPVTTDVETIWNFVKQDDNTIKAKLRIASYLNAQSDKLYFEAKNRAVCLADYTLELRKRNNA